MVQVNPKQYEKWKRKAEQDASGKTREAALDEMIEELEAIEQPSIRVAKLHGYAVQLRER